MENSGGLSSKQGHPRHAEVRAGGTHFRDHSDAATRCKRSPAHKKVPQYASTAAYTHTHTRTGKMCGAKPKNLCTVCRKPNPSVVQRPNRRAESVGPKASGEGRGGGGRAAEAHRLVGGQDKLLQKLFDSSIIYSERAARARLRNLIEPFGCFRRDVFFFVGWLVGWLPDFNVPLPPVHAGPPRAICLGWRVAAHRRGRCRAVIGSSKLAGEKFHPTKCLMI